MLALAVLLVPAAMARKRAPRAEVTLPFAVDPNPSSYRPLPRTDTIITHATVLDGAGQRIDDGDVLIRDGRIVAVGKAIGDRGNATVIDARGRWVTPGVIDIHSHNGTYVVPLTSIDEKSSDISELTDANVADTWIESAINPQDTAFYRALEGGVTTLQVLPGSSPIFGGRSVILKPVPATIVAAMKFPGARQGMKMACGENPKSQGAESGRGPTSRQGEVAFIRKAFLSAQDYARQWERYARGESAEPPQRDLKNDTLAAVLRGDIAINWHCYRADEMATMIGLAHEFNLRIATFHHAAEAYKIAPLLQKEGICVAVWADWWGFKMEANDGIRENAAILDAAGNCVMMHSDSPLMGQRLNIEAAKAAAAGRRAGIALPPERVIMWLTSNPARALGLGDRIGTIAPGRNADIVIWSGDPFSIFTRADTVFIDGAVAYDRRDPARQPRSDFELGRTGEARP